jgi:hypothetical protein
MTNQAEIRTFDGKSSYTTTYGMAVDARWGGYPKNGYITLHVLKGPDEYLADATATAEGDSRAADRTRVNGRCAAWAEA